MNSKAIQARDLARQRLARYAQLIAAWRVLWGMEPDREAHLNAWAQSAK